MSDPVGAKSKNAFRRVRCQAGAPVTQVNEPVIELVGGPKPYLWIGNGQEPQWCFATLSNKREVRRLRDWLDLMLDEEPRV